MEGVNVNKTTQYLGKASDLTQERVKQLFSYDCETGTITRRSNVSNQKAGIVVGSLDKPSGYINLRIDGKLYRIHSIIWLYMTGSFPNCHIDHIDTDKTNNSWSNLRLATKAQNGFNRGKNTNNTSGFKGVSFSKAEHKWKAKIQANGHVFHLGTYDCPAAAHFSYIIAADELHGEFARAS